MPKFPSYRFEGVQKFKTELPVGTPYRFSVIVREDGKVGLFSPEANQSLVMTVPEFEAVFQEMIKRGHPEIMPDTTTGIGLSFGSMSKSAWKEMVSVARRIGVGVL